MQSFQIRNMKKNYFKLGHYLNLDFIDKKLWKRAVKMEK